MHHLCPRASSKKQQQQAELQARIESYLSQGGTIDVLPKDWRSTHTPKRHTRIKSNRTKRMPASRRHNEPRGQQTA